MTSDKHDFEELDAPSTAAEKLGISVATLRKYSLIVEKLTGNDQYYERTKQRSRLYHQKDIDDLNAFHKLAKTNGLTLQEAARQIYAVTDKKSKVTNTHNHKNNPQNELMSPPQVVKLLGALQQTIASQNEAIDNLQKQLNRIEKQNQELIKSQQLLTTDVDVDPKIAAMPDISGIVDQPEEKAKTAEEKRAEVDADAQKSKAQMHEQILQKAKENAEKRASDNVHRTLEDMQLPRKKKHWWQRFINY